MNEIVQLSEEESRAKVDTLLEKIKAIEALKAKILDGWRQTFEARDMVSVPGADWDMITLTRSTYPGIDFQVTRWEHDDGQLVPRGHVDVKGELQKALEELWWFAKKPKLDPRS